MITAAVTDESKPLLIERGFVEIGTRGKYTTLRRRAPQKTETNR